MRQGVLEPRLTGDDISGVDLSSASVVDYDELVVACSEAEYALVLRATRAYLERHPDDFRFRELHCIALARSGDLAMACAGLESLVRQYPDNAQCWFNLGVYRHDSGDTSGAMLAYAQSLRLCPGHLDAMWNYAELLRLDGQFDLALRYFSLIESREDVAWRGDLLHRKAVTLANINQFDEARRYFDMALMAGTSNEAVTRWEYSQLRLKLEDYDAGWSLYESRGLCAGVNGVFVPSFGLPRWDGIANHDNTLLIHGEQGIGDEIMFASMLPEVIADAGRVIIACNPALVRIFENSFPACEVAALVEEDGAPVVKSDAAPNHEFPLASLGLLKRQAPESFLHSTPYLQSDPDDVMWFREQLEQRVPDIGRKLKVGIAWGANPARDVAWGRRRSLDKSIAPNHLHALRATEDFCTFVSLQNAQVGGEAAYTGLDIVDFQHDLVDMAKTAALTENLDLVISVDTSIAHLTGALGKPVWVLLKANADWRWHVTGSGSRWYPTARLFRQPRSGDWAQVLGNVREALRAFNAAS